MANGGLDFAKLDKMTPNQAAAALRKLEDERLHDRWCIELQWRNPAGCPRGADPQDWRSWRLFACLPMLFHSETAAWLWMRSNDVFETVRGMRKPSACATKVRINDDENA